MTEERRRPRPRRIPPVLALVVGVCLMAYGVRPMTVALMLVSSVGRSNQGYLLGQVAVPTLAFGEGIVLVVVSLKKMRDSREL